MKKRNFNVGAIILTVILTAVMMTGGFFAFLRYADKLIVPKKEYESNEKLIKKFEKLIDIDNLIESDFLYEFDKDKQSEAMYDAMLSSLDDEYSRYLNKDELEKLKKSLNNSFTGIGISFEMTDKGVLITDVMSESPAQTAGLQKGDIILEIDGRECKTIKAVKKAISGKAGEAVELKIMRGSEEKKVKVIRGEIEDSTVDSKEISDKTAYIKITSFGEQTYSKFESALSSFEKSGKQSLILDLRSNPGGLFDEGIKIADRLLPECKITYTKDKRGKIKNYNSDVKGTKLKLIVLIDENSASSSEIVVAALIDNKAAISVGQKSYGKGVVQESHIYSDDTAISITVKEYFSPTGKKINGKGIEPQFAVENIDGNDLQLAKAIELASV